MNNRKRYFLNDHVFCIYIFEYTHLIVCLYIFPASYLFPTFTRKLKLFDKFTKTSKLIVNKNIFKFPHLYFIYTL